jgi:hypothetical protein
MNLTTLQKLLNNNADMNKNKFSPSKLLMEFLPPQPITMTKLNTSHRPKMKWVHLLEDLEGMDLGDPIL